MNHTREIIDLKNRVKELEKAIQKAAKKTIEEFADNDDSQIKNSKEIDYKQPKFKAWESYKSNMGLVVICTKDGFELEGYGLDGAEVWSNTAWLSDLFTQKATPEETESMLRKACEIWGGEDWENVKIKSHAGNTNKLSKNDRAYLSEINNGYIYNRNGCIMYQGKWAEKLEEYQDGEKYICIYDDAKHFVLKYSKERNLLFRGKNQYDIKHFQTIEPYTQERLIELAEKF